MLIIFCAEIEEAQHIDCPKAKIVITGPGLCNVIQTPRLNVTQTDKIINIGYAGSNKYEVGEVVSVYEARRFSPSLTIQERSISLATCYFSDICYTADDFVEDTTFSDIPLIDMELYYLASIYPQIEALKIVSDNLSYSEYKKADFKASWKTVNEVLSKL